MSGSAFCLLSVWVKMEASKFLVDMTQSVGY